MSLIHPGFSSAHDLIVPGPESGYTVSDSDYPNARDQQVDFLSQFSSHCCSRVHISFEPDNGWMDVDDVSGQINLLLAGNSSSYRTRSPYYPSSTGKTTLLPGTATGSHNPNANASATIQYLDTTSAAKGVRVNFSLYNIGNITPGLDEAGLALEHPQINIDRGTNTTTTGSSPNQILQIVPSERAEGGLRVEFSGIDATGTAWSNPVYAFGFYLSGREEKRDVYLDVKDIYGNLIHSSVTTEGEIVTPTAAVEYISFKAEANENPIGSFELREEYNGEDEIWRDIFSIDDLTLFTGLTFAGAETSYDEIARNKLATTITDSDYPNSKSLRDSFITSLGTKRRETITFEPYNGWMDVNNPPSSLTSKNYQFLAGANSAYGTLSTTNIASGDSVTLKTGSNNGSHTTTTSAGADGEVIHMNQSGSKVSFTFTNVANAGSGDEPDLARVHDRANIDRGINVTSGSAPDTGSRYDQFLEILPNEKDEGQLKVSFEGEDNSGNTWSNPAYDLGFYLMGREIKRDVCLKVYDINGALIHNEVTREPSTVDNATVQYFSFSVENNDPISYFTLTEEFHPDDASDSRDIFSIDDLTFSTQQNKTVLPGNFKLFNADNVSSLSLEFVAQINGEQINKLNSLSFQGFSQAQVSALSNTAIDSIKKNQFSQFKAEALSGLEAEQVSAIKPSNFRILSAEQLSNFSPDAVNALSKSQLRRIESDSIRGFSADQISKIPPLSFRGIKSTQLTGFSSSMVKALTQSQIEQMRRRTIRGFTANQLNALDSSQIESLPKRLIRVMSPEQLSSLSDDAITGFKANQLRTFSDDALTNFTTNQIASLKATSMAGLRAATLDQVSKQQAAVFTEIQLLSINKRQLKKAESFANQLSLEQREILGLNNDNDPITSEKQSAFSTLLQSMGTSNL